MAIQYRINAGIVPTEHWIHDPEQGGGRILGEVCHFVDFAIFLTGSMPLSVQASTLPDSGKYTGDNVFATIRFSNGSIASITYVANGDRSLPKERCEVFGGNCVAILDDFRRLQLNRDGRRTIWRSWLRKDKGHVGEWKAMVDALRKGGLEPIRYEEIVAGMLTTIAIRDSIHNGEVHRDRSSSILWRLPTAVSIQKRLNYYRRVARAYLTSNPSQLTFWHEVPEVNSNTRTDVLSEYPMLFRSKADYPGPFDDQGVPKLNYHGTIGVQYNPIAIAQYGLANYNLYRQGNANDRRDKFITVADWLVQNLEQTRFGTWVWNHHFDWDYRTPLKAPWYSGLAQGQGISVLVRAFQDTKESRYLEAASKALDTFFRETKDGGVIHFDKQGDLWVEEYLVEPPTHILNGFMWGIWGLYDYALMNSDTRVKQLFDRSADTIARNLHRYDIGYWSLYELSGTRLHMIASPFYHSLHIVQLRIMTRLTGRSTFEEFANRWDAYRASPVKRTAALAYKAAFKLCYY